MNDFNENEKLNEEPVSEPAPEAFSDEAANDFLSKVFEDGTETVSEEPVRETTENDIDRGFAPTGNYSYTSINIPPKKEKQKISGKTVVLSCILSALIAFAAAYGAFYAMGTKFNTNTASNTGGTVTNITVKDKLSSSAIEAVAAKAIPSVVGIRTTAAVTNFFGGTQDSTGEGSGIVYTSDGYIITNYHVISSAIKSTSSKIEVFFDNAKTTAVPATVVGYNVSSDLAVIKVNKTGLTPIELGKSDSLAVGEYAIAIGSPGGLEYINSVTLGIISGLNREVTTDNKTTMTLIQTDAAINPGNSGGALLDINGKLIGVNSAKLVDTSFENMGFAIPVDSVKTICDKIISRQYDPTPYIGIEISQRYSYELLVSLGYPGGAVVDGVASGSPAALSGIARGDIITEVNGAAVSGYDDFNEKIAATTPGQSITVKLYRSGRFYSASIKVGSNNEQ